MTREELKFIELFFKITNNGNTIPFTVEMEQLVTKNPDYHYYIRLWNSLLNSKKMRLGDNFQEWFDNLHEISDIDKYDLDRLPEEPIEVSVNNETFFVTTLRRIFQDFLSQVEPYCAPAVPDSNVTAYYDITNASFSVAVYSFDERDVKTRRKFIESFNNMLAKINSEIDKFNELQGIGKGTKNILISSPNIANSLGVYDENKSYERGHIVDKETEFEQHFSIDEIHLYKEGKGNSMPKKEIIDFFNILPEEHVAVGKKRYNK